MIGRSLRGEERGIGKEKGQMTEYLLPPRPLDNNNLCVHISQPSICNAHPAPWPPHSTLPLARAPYQNASDDPPHQRDLLPHLDDPVDGATHSAPIFAGPQEQEVGEAGDPDEEE